jgi:hypothetical protein
MNNPCHSTKRHNITVVQVNEMCSLLLPFSKVGAIFWAHIPMALDCWRADNQGGEWTVCRVAMLLIHGSALMMIRSNDTQSLEGLAYARANEHTDVHDRDHKHHQQQKQSRSIRTKSHVITQDAVKMEFPQEVHPINSSLINQSYVHAKSELRIRGYIVFVGHFDNWEQRAYLLVGAQLSVDFDRKMVRIYI